MPHRFPHTVLATLVAVLVAGTIAWAQRELVTSDWPSRSSLPIHRSSVAVAGAPAVDLQIHSAASVAAVERLRDTTDRAVRILNAWLGPLPGSGITVVDLPWHLDAPGAAYAGVIFTRTRWLAPERDLLAERSLIAGLARQYWLPGSPSADPWFREGLVIYTATRGIHTALEGRNFAAPRYVGGFVSFPLRAQLLSPSPQGPRPTLDAFDEVLEPAGASWRFAPAGEGSAARRTAMALTTLERAIGWPAMQQALLETRLRANTQSLTPELLGAVLGEQRGVSMEWFVRKVLRAADTIDYAIGEVQSEQVAGRTRTTVSVARAGSGEFAATDLPRSDGPARSLDVLIRFDDGTEARAFIDGRDPSTQLSFDSASSPTVVLLDPEQLVMIDADRSNNGRVLRYPPAGVTGVRLVLNWMLWLQNLMLTSTAIA